MTSTDCKRSHLTVSVDAEKARGKSQHLLVINTLSKLGTERNFLDLAKNIYSLQLTSFSRAGCSKLSH